MKKALLALALVLGLAGVVLIACDQKPAAPAAPAPDATPAPTPTPLPTAYPPVEPPAPGAPGGLPDDRTPISEAPFTPQSAQGAADVVQVYAASLGEKDYAKAYAQLRSPTQSLVEFTQSFAKYYQYNMQVGAPGQMEGAAGSSYIEVPVLIYGRLKTGETVNELGSATLKRVNDVDGSTAEQRLWRIVKIETRPTAASGVANG
jgi:hypothetical protein